MAGALGATSTVPLRSLGAGRVHPDGAARPLTCPRPCTLQDLATLLEQIGCLKYLQLFEEQDVDLRIFLTLTESDLKEIGIT